MSSSPSAQRGSDKIRAHLRRRGLTLSALPNSTPSDTNAAARTQGSHVNDAMFQQSHRRASLHPTGAAARARPPLVRSQTHASMSPHTPLAPVEPRSPAPPGQSGGRFRRQFNPRRGTVAEGILPLERATSSPSHRQLDGSVSHYPRHVVNFLEYVSAEKLGLMIADLCKASPVDGDAAAPTQLKQLREAERRLAKMGRILSETSRTVNANELDQIGFNATRKRIFRDATEVASYALDCKVQALFHNPEKRKFEYWMPGGEEGGEGKIETIDIEDNSSFSRVVEGQTVNYGSSLIMSHDAILDELKDTIKSILIIPMVNEAGELFGCLRAVNKTDPIDAQLPATERSFVPQVFSKEDEKMGHIIASHCVRQLCELEHLVQSRTKSENDTRLLQLVQEVASSELDSLTALMGLIMDHACQILRADRCSLFLIDQKAGQLWSVVAQDTKERIVIPLEQGICGAVARSGEIVNVPDAYLDPRFNPQVDQKTGYRTKSLLAIPVVRGKGGDIIGVMQMLNKQDGGRFSEDDVRLVKLYSTFAGIGLHNSQTHENVRQKERLATTLLTVNKALSQELELDTLIGVIMQSARDLLNADRCTLFLIDKSRRELWSRLADGDKEIRIPLGTGVAGHCAQTGETLNIADAYSYPKFNQSVDRVTGYKTVSILACPIRDQDGEVIGVTQMINKKIGRDGQSPELGRQLPTTSEEEIVSFTKSDEDLMEAFSSHASLSLTNSNLYQKTLNMRNYLEGVLRSITDTVLTFDSAGRLLTCNSDLISTLVPGVSVDDLKSKQFSKWITPEGNQELHDDLQGVLAGEEEMAMGYDYEFKSGNGSQNVSVNYHAMPYRSADGDPRGAVLVLQDVSPQRRMMQTLSRYMSAEKAQLVLADQEATLGGSDLKATVLFSDMRNYTQFSQNLNGAQIVETLNSYFSHMTPFVIEQQGIVDKYIGDALMAVFGSPMPKTDDSTRACRAALRISRAVRGYSAQREQLGQVPVVEVGIGLSTGPVVSGNIGTQARMEFTVIGHTVNLSSRIEGATKYYGVNVLICDVTFAEVKSIFHGREVDLVKLVGVKEAIPLYELISEKQDTSSVQPGLIEALPIYNKALKLYRAAEFTKALGEFEKVIGLVGTDRVSSIYVERCQSFIAQPPSDTWDGSFTMPNK